MRFVVALLAVACVALASEMTVETTTPKNGPVISEVISRPRMINATDDIDIDKIIAIGKKVWEIIKAGQPVVDYKNDWAGVVPKDAKWDDLEGFRDAKWGPFGWTFKNTIGMRTVEFKWHFAWSCKGSYNGHGSFLMNVGTAIETIYAAWGFTVNVNAAVDQNPVNYGTKIDPVAGLAIEVTLENKTVLQSFTQKCRVIVRADCTGTILSCA